MILVLRLESQFILELFGVDEYYRKEVPLDDEKLIEAV